MTCSTPLVSIKQSLQPELDRLNELITSSLTSSNALMNTIVEGYLMSKGKQIRPILVILAAKMLGEINDHVFEAAAAVEMLHNASLIHDDVVDESKMRHSRPTINSVWDNHLAVLVGDFFVSTALNKAISTGDLRVVNSIALLGKELSLGELDQIYNARFHSIDEESYFGIISRKTASLFISCVEMGAYTVGVDDSRLDALREFARLLGLCFQIKDDIFDYFTNDAIGKPTGNDLREGKITLPLIYALSLEAHPQHEQMNALARGENLDADSIAALIEFAKQAGGIEYAVATMTRLRDEAVRVLDTIDDPRGIAPAFRSLIDYIINRDF
ncbi:MAG: polyprenyl synthetase family protein [Muribaculaceae bacterium]|nr:polyprenyl synthetase family protein [Muribaculaceae bacterium]